MLVLSAHIFRKMFPFQCNTVYMLCLSRACLINSLMKYCVTKWKFIICFYAFVQVANQGRSLCPAWTRHWFFHAAFEQNSFSILFFFKYRLLKIFKQRDKVLSFQLSMLFLVSPVRDEKYCFTKRQITRYLVFH